MKLQKVFTLEDVGRPTMEPFFLSKNYRDFEVSSLGVLVFRRTLRPI